jgi:signal transduction histidine kinase
MIRAVQCSSQSARVVRRIAGTELLKSVRGWVSRATSRRAWIEDVTLAGTALAVWIILARPMRFDIALVAASAAISILLRRKSPSVALALTWLMAIAQIATSQRPNLFDAAALVVVGTLAATGRRFELWASGISAVLGGVFGLFYLGRTEIRFEKILYTNSFELALLAALVPTLLLGSAWLAGLAVRSSRARRNEYGRRSEAERVASVAEEIARLERARTELARDVHDVVGHSLTVIIAQANAVEFFSDIDQIRKTVATISNTASTSLAEVRSVLDVTEFTSQRAVVSSIDALLANVAAAGITVQRHVGGSPRTVSTQVRVLLQRVMQELLANALKHGSEAQTIGVLEVWGPSELLIEVKNSIRVPVKPGSGSGLPGLRGRLASAGGQFDATVIDGVFFARARIPTTAIDNRTIA